MRGKQVLLSAVILGDIGWKTSKIGAAGYMDQGIWADRKAIEKDMHKDSKTRREGAAGAFLPQSIECRLKMCDTYPSL